MGGDMYPAKLVKVCESWLIQHDYPKKKVVLKCWMNKQKLEKEDARGCEYR